MDCEILSFHNVAFGPKFWKIITMGQEKPKIRFQREDKNLIHSCLLLNMKAFMVFLVSPNNGPKMRFLEVWQKSRLLMSVFVLLNIKVLMGFILSLKTGCPGLLCNWCSHLFKLNTVECCQNRIFCFRFHLQAFRHLYVLACEPRLFITRDVDTKKICYAPIKVRLKVKLDIIGHAR